MKINGQFNTSASIAQLRALQGQPAALANVATLRDVSVAGGGVIEALFTPKTSFGRLPIAVRITPEPTGDNGGELRVHGRRGQHVIDVDIRLSFAGNGTATAVSWDADVVVRGPAASVGQRVARDLTRQAIADVLQAAAAAATG